MRSVDRMVIYLPTYHLVNVLAPVIALRRRGVLVELLLSSDAFRGEAVLGGLRADVGAGEPVRHVAPGVERRVRRVVTGARTVEQSALLVLLRITRLDRKPHEVLVLM